MTTVVHKNVALLVVADSQALDEVRALVDLDDYVMGQLSETEWVVDPAKAVELQKRLAGRGVQALCRRAHGDRLNRTE